MGFENFLIDTNQASFQRECLTTEMNTTSPTVKNNGGGQDQGQGQEVERGGKGDTPHLTRRKLGIGQGLKHLQYLSNNS